MHQLSLTTEEWELLQQVLQGYLARLEVEINHTDHTSFKAELKQRRSVMNQLLERCSATHQPIG